MKDRLEEPSCASPEGQAQYSNEGETGNRTGRPLYLPRRAAKGVFFVKAAEEVC